MDGGVQIKVVGGKELQTRLMSVDEALRKHVLKTAVQMASLIVQNDAKRKAPVKSGHLRRSIHSEIVQSTTTRAVGKIGTNVEYAPYLEFGTATHATLPGVAKVPYEILPRRKKALYWPGAPHPVKRVMHPGIAPRPYLRPALDENIDQVKAKIASVIDRELQRIGK